MRRTKMSSICLESNFPIPWLLMQAHAARPMARTVAAMVDQVKPGAISVSLIKGGLDLKDNKLQLCSDVLRQVLGHDVSVLMGANVANDVAAGQFCEATLGYSHRPG